LVEISKFLYKNNSLILEEINIKDIISKNSDFNTFDKIKSKEFLDYIIKTFFIKSD